MANTITVTDDITKLPVACMVSKCADKALNCFWDRHPIAGPVIKCPIRYKPKQLIKMYTDSISNENYTIKENCIQSDQSSDDKYLYIDSHYETMDAFCSFSCCLAWIRAMKHDYTYSQSEILLYKMWNEHNTNTPLHPAPSWRLLIPYGGTMTIDEFRSCRDVVQLKTMVLDNMHLFESHAVI